MVATTDPNHGGRWTSLLLGGREWLWRRDDPTRFGVSPGSTFVDAGGLEECIPTVRGTPDHGDVWSRPWLARAASAAFVETATFRLDRQITEARDTVTADYRLQASPGYRFVWAAHALLDLAVGARIELPQGTRVRIYRRLPVCYQRPGPWIVLRRILLARM
jgi:hypothetical protein